MEELINQLWSYVVNLKDIIHPLRFVINLIVCTILSIAVANFYIRFGNAVSNRRRFAANFVPLALTTMSIMVIVKPSVALSLGLVGALSIVRFRAAIKDPEELTYLFLTIAVGLATGADQPLIAIIVVLFILIFLYVNQRLSSRDGFEKEDRVYINITTDLSDAVQISNVLKASLAGVQLKRMDTLSSKGLDLSFICKAAPIERMQTVKDALLTLSPQTQISIIDQPDLII